jgi:hypothetical protein
MSSLLRSFGGITTLIQTESHRALVIPADLHVKAKFPPALAKFVLKATSSTIAPLNRIC